MMNPFRSRRAALVFTFSYILAAGAYLISIGDTEFTRYLIILLIAAIFLAIYRNQLPLPVWLLWLLSITGLLHLLGGTVSVGGDVLYAYVPFHIENPFGLTILKYDQITHAFGSGVATLAVFAFLREARGISLGTIGLVAFLAALGVGAINEIIELHVKLTVPDSGVGGYYNNALDLVFNAVGAGISVAVAMRWLGKKN